jgi:hypothetical protein
VVIIEACKDRRNTWKETPRIWARSLDFVQFISGAEGVCRWNSASRKPEAIVAEHVSLCREEDPGLDGKYGEDAWFDYFNRDYLLRANIDLEDMKGCP